MKDIYSNKNSDYLEKTKTWHAEDSPWKAKQVLKILNKHNINPQSVVEVGCGVGEILYSLNEKISDKQISFEGFDIAEDEINIAKKKNVKNVNFHVKDFTSCEKGNYDLLLMMDVFEHVPDYIGFIQKCNAKAKYKIYHIPLEIHLNSVLRNRMIYSRQEVGHLHYFTKETALATLEDTGQEIIDFFYTPCMVERPNKSLKTKIANVFRRIMFAISPDITVKLLGGYSLLVITK